MAVFGDDFDDMMDVTNDDDYGQADEKSYANDVSEARRDFLLRLFQDHFRDNLLGIVGCRPGDICSIEQHGSSLHIQVHKSALEVDG